uniref:Rieske domain-containing protein n=1 Tax=Salarias fasciatus TaxID=181472 RepID=A0A672HC41_SALFA
MHYTMDEEKQPTGGLHFVGKKDELIKAKRCVRPVEDRDVLIIHARGRFFALDSHCYHAGGELLNGDIEEINGRLCMVCPRHKYKICVADGEGLYTATDTNENPPVKKWYSYGVKQRTHLVKEINGDVFVKLSRYPGWLESDFYQGERGKVERVKAAEAAKKKSSKS